MVGMATDTEANNYEAIGISNQFFLFSFVFFGNATFSATTSVYTGLQLCFQ